MAGVDLESVGVSELGRADATGRPRQRSVSIDDNGMGDPLRFDAERLRILVERHLLFTGSERARALLDDWEGALSKFVKVLPREYKRALLELHAQDQASKVAAAE
jgi:glutamate synthase (NADPH/NADH) large chain